MDSIEGNSNMLTEHVLAKYECVQGDYQMLTCSHMDFSGARECGFTGDDYDDFYRIRTVTKDGKIDCNDLYSKEAANAVFLEYCKMAKWKKV